VFVGGGLDENLNIVNTALMYSFADDGVNWIQVPAMPTARAYLSCGYSEEDDHIVVAGGKSRRNNTE